MNIKGHTILNTYNVTCQIIVIVLSVYREVTSFRIFVYKNLVLDIELGHLNVE